MRTINLLAAVVFAALGAGCAAGVDPAPPAPETTAAEGNEGYETDIPRHLENANEKWLIGRECRAYTLGLDPLVLEAATGIDYVPRDVTKLDIPKAFELPALRPFTHCD